MCVVNKLYCNLKVISFLINLTHEIVEKSVGSLKICSEVYKLNDYKELPRCLPNNNYKYRHILFLGELYYFFTYD